MTDHVKSVEPQTVQAFLATLASGDPAPGGGAAAALGGALAAALVAMVSRVTAARTPAVKDEMIALTATADELRERLTALMTEDMEAYRGVIEARRSAQPDVIERAMRRATAAPLAMAMASASVLAACESAAQQARPSALSDLGVAAALGWAALEASALTARTNLADQPRAPFVETAERELAIALESGRESRGRALDTIEARLRSRTARR